MLQAVNWWDIQATNRTPRALAGEVAPITLRPRRPCILIVPPHPASSALHPLHALFLAFPVALFPSALMADITYLNSAEMQWSNFAAWLITGALLFGAPALLWALVWGIFARAFLYPLLLGAAWVLGLVNAFQHSRDGWSSVGATGIILSMLSTLLVLAAAWTAHSAKGKAA